MQDAAAVDRVLAGLDIHQLLQAMVDKNASDLHITVGTPPQLRIDGSLYPVKIPPLRPQDTQRLCYSVLTELQKKKFEERNEIDMSFQWKGISRFRANFYRQRGAVAGALRQIPTRIMSFEELSLPSVVHTLVDKPRGLILVTGATGSGKSTTLASMIDTINQRRRGHIITIEDPIEFVHQHKNCVVNQREVGSDTLNFEDALRYVMRQDPDVVLVGEIRDTETMETALRLSETGHLVLSTLHTNSTVQTINRVMDLFPPEQQDRVRTQFSFVIEGILCQQLLPRMDGKGRVLALEILVPTPAIRNLIREGKNHQIYSQMQVGQAKFGMQTLNQALFRLWQARLASRDEVLVRSGDPDELISMMTQAATPTGGQ
ncbi:MAG: PilT/PilU family type 4a pilus ATPase [Deltaproteobacteria bacterium]|nr:PilT/PilU family type 4a pilus ATPase [Deltaproteobacteria bacterium]